MRDGALMHGQTEPTHPFLLHVDDERAPAEAAHAEEVHVLVAVQLLRRLRRARALRRGRNERLDVVREQRLIIRGRRGVSQQRARENERRTWL